MFGNVWDALQGFMQQPGTVAAPVPRPQGNPTVPMPNNVAMPAAQAPNNGPMMQQAFRMMRPGQGGNIPVQGRFMQQAMQRSGVPGLLAQQQQQAQQQPQPPAGYMPRELLQWLQQNGGGNASASGSFGGLPINLGMGGTPYR